MLSRNRPLERRRLQLIKSACRGALVVVTRRMFAAAKKAHRMDDCVEPHYSDSATPKTVDTIRS